PGAEIAGVVESVGAGVSFKPGDRVIASVGWNGMAVKAKTQAGRVMPIPSAMSFDEGSAFILTYRTSYYALKDRGVMRPGETLLVLGAAGGVGIAAVELGKAMGARVVAAVSSEEKAAFAKDAGADDAIIYPASGMSKQQSKDLAESFKKACNGG